LMETFIEITAWALGGLMWQLGRRTAGLRGGMIEWFMEIFTRSKLNANLRMRFKRKNICVE
jgi:hypothetical protein